MGRHAIWVAVLVIFFVVPVVGGELPQVLQPNSTAYSSTEVAALIGALSTLERILSDEGLGSRRTFTARDWQSLDFAAYTAGTLAELGYATRLVSQVGWPDEVDPSARHVWVLVRLPYSQGAAWVPVEPSPALGRHQQLLGRLPTTSDSAGALWFETRYTTFSETVDLPPNSPPVAKIRPPVLPITTGETVQLMSVGSYDPDGEIILYLWDLDDGTKMIWTAPTYQHTFAKEGNNAISLTVIDNRGKRSTTSLTLRVKATQPWDKPDRSERSEGGCGCGS